MTNNIKVPLGKKDGLLRYWWENAQDKDINISKAVVAALEYYMLTGDFLTLATVEDIPRTYENAVVKWVYISQDNEVYAWLKARQSSGEKISVIIKYVLRNSLIRSYEESFCNNDDMFRVLDKARRGHNIVPIQNPAVQQPVKEVVKKEIMQEKVDAKVVEPRPKAENPVYEADDEEDTGFNIFDQLIGGNGLNLG